jgi:tetratricopeptide (TPR) repeat protein
MLALLLLSLLVPQAAPDSSAPPRTRRRPEPRSEGAGRDPYARIQEAKALLDAGEYERVLKIVDGLLRQHPSSPSSHLLRAMALDELARLDEAERSYQAALRSAPHDPQILIHFGMHFLRREAWTGAIRYLERGLESGPDALASFYLAQAYFHTDSKAKALEAIEKSAALAPKNPTILVKLGEYRAQASKHSAALEALRRAQQLNPNEPGLDLALGIVQLSLLDVEAARAALERAAVQEPENLAVLSNLATACSKARDHAAAKRYYEKLIARGQDDAPYHLGLGSALLGLGDNDAAIRELNLAAEKNPRLAETHFHLARAYRSAGHPDESQRELRLFQALKASPFQPFDERADLEKSLWRRAETLVKEGKEAEALKLLAAGNSPGNQPSYLVGALYYSLGRYADAERLLTQALAIAPTLAKLRAYLGLAYLGQGRIVEAEKAIGEEAAQNPREPFVLMAIGQLHFRKKEWAEAARYLQESRVVEPEVLLMLCEAQLESGRRAEAQETAQLLLTLSAGDAELLAAVRRLLDRHQLPLETGPDRSPPPPAGTAS